MKIAPSTEKMFFPLSAGAVLRPARTALAPAAYDKRLQFLTLVLSGIVLTGLSVAFIDRPVSTWLHAGGHSVSILPKLAWRLEPFLPATTGALAAIGVITGLSRQPSAWTKTLIACCLAMLVALVLKEQLKFVFGRTWPESWKPGAPSWIGTGAYGFHPFHGGWAWASFPSGHTAAVTAVAGVLWQRARRLRWLWGSLVLLVTLVLVTSDCHFVGDIVAGFYLGLGCAALVLAFVA